MSIDKTYTELANYACDAMDILMNSALLNVEFDKTIIATIAACVDEAAGEYKIKFQDAYYYASIAGSDVSYQKGESVYVLIPSGDLSKPKKIIGAVDNSSEGFLENNTNLIPKYDIIGNDIVLENKEFAYSSFSKNYMEKIYDADNVENNLINIDIAALHEHMQYATQFQISAEIKTTIPLKQRSQGDFGIIVEADFYEDNTDSSTTKTFILNTNSMIGTVYNLASYLKQSSRYEINGKLFQRIKSIFIFIKDFLYEDENLPLDIYFQNIQISPMVETDSKIWNGYYLNLKTPYGATLNENIKKIEIQAIGTFKNKTINKDKLKYYWFIKNSAISANHKNFNLYGGQGWQCLNDYEDSEDGRFWKDGDSTFIVKDSMMQATSAEYKCVAIYNNNTTLVKEITIYNTLSQYKINLYSPTDTTTFLLSRGKTDLICDIKTNNFTNISLGEDNFNYYWSKSNSQGNYEILDTNNGGNIAIDSVVSNKDLYFMCKDLLVYFTQGFESGKILKTEKYHSYKFNSIADGDYSFEGHMNLINKVLSLEEEEIILGIYPVQEIYERLVNYVNNTSISFIDKNHFYNLSAKIIDGVNNITCTVFSKNIETGADETYIGTGTITLRNIINSDNLNYTLNLINGNQTFKYDAAGKSPTHETNVAPQIINSLSFEIYDKLGNKIDINENTKLSVKWSIPKENTMLLPSKEEIFDFIVDYSQLSAYERDIQSHYIFNGLTLSFSIIDKYNTTAINNNILLEVSYDGNILQTSTNFTFLKDGNSGTNGTDFYCRIVPTHNTNNYPTLYCGYNNLGEHVITSNFISDIDIDISDGTLPWFSAELWNAGEKITPNYVSWQILTNYSHWNCTPFNITRNGNSSLYAEIDYNALEEIINEQKNPQLTIQACVQYNGKKYFATQPVALVYLFTPIDKHLLYKIEMKAGTGFNEAMYSSDGTNPEYADAYPFEINVKYRQLQEEGENISFKEIDITNNTEVNEDYKTPFIYDWNVYGELANHITKIETEEIVDIMGPPEKEDEDGEDSSSIVIGQETIKKIEYIAKQDWLLTLKDIGEPTSFQKQAIPPQSYDGLSLNNGIVCSIVDKDNFTIAKIFFPIHFYLNRYGFSHLNDWDGNSIKINNDDGYILSPQIGAGKKNADNTFTGMIMGEVKTEDKSNIGLFAYGNGLRTMFLDAETGSGYFGSQNEIQFVPDGNETKVQLGPWNLNAESFWKGSSEWGAAGVGNVYIGDKGLSLGSRFTYDSEKEELNIPGLVKENAVEITTAKIGPWEIDTDEILNEDETITIIPKSIFINSPNFANSASGSKYLGIEGFSIRNGFQVDSNGDTIINTLNVNNTLDLGTKGKLIVNGEEIDFDSLSEIGQIGGINNSISSLQRAVSTLQNTVSTQGNKITELEREIDNIKTYLGIF